jgi:hypothetical protein
MPLPAAIPAATGTTKILEIVPRETSIAKLPADEATEVPFTRVFDKKRGKRSEKAMRTKGSKMSHRGAIARPHPNLDATVRWMDGVFLIN